MSRKLPPLSDRVRSIFALQLLLGVSFVTFFGLTASAQTANLWIGPSGGTCTRSATPAAYNSGTACGSMQAAQTAAQGGDTVIIKNGTYGSQSITSGTKASVVTYQAETYRQVFVGGLTISEVDNIHIVGVTTSLGANNASGTVSVTHRASDTPWTDVTIDGFQGKNAWIPADHVTLIHTEFGNWDVCQGAGNGTQTGNAAIEDAVRFWGWGTSHVTSPDSDRLLNSYIHDIGGGSDGACGFGSNGPHVDLLQSYPGGTNIVVDGNTFSNPSGGSNIQLGGGTIGSFLVQNNYFNSTHQNTLSMGQGACSGIIIQNNVINGQMDNGGGCTGSPTHRNNIFTASVNSCTNGVAFNGSNNIFPGAGGTTCGANSKRCTPSWLNGTPSTSNRFDIRLSASDTCAKDSGDASDFAPTDLFGTLRPQGLAPDAGAFEILESAGGGVVNPPTNLVSVVQ
jgi:hypothetical protein